MNIVAEIRRDLERLLDDPSRLTVEPAQPEYGDLTSNFPVLAPKPKSSFKNNVHIENFHVSDKRFLNIRIKTESYGAYLKSIIAVIPAQAGGVHRPTFAGADKWIPACAGMASYDAFRISYLHNLCHAILRHADKTESLSENVEVTPGDRDLVRLLSLYPWALERASATESLTPVCRYLLNLVQTFNEWWRQAPEGTLMRVIDPADPKATLARLAIVQGVQQTIALSPVGRGLGEGHEKPVRTI